MNAEVGPAVVPKEWDYGTASMRNAEKGKQLKNSGITNYRTIIAFMLALLLAATIWFDSSEAASPKTQYHTAESCYRELRADANKR